MSAIEVVENGQHGEVTSARESAQQLSQHLVRPAHWDIPTGGSVFGTFAIYPFENLHLFNLGLLKYMLFALFNFVVVPDSIKRWYRRRRGLDGEPPGVESSGHASDGRRQGQDGDDASIHRNAAGNDASGLHSVEGDAQFGKPPVK